ncbi:Csac_0668 family 2Fe-2S cluster-binding (seleno)protein [Anaerosolibacter sp.]|uniref:Csac_0668 family 2Fe-2S cluster-binding (seleno)protein n=1 Tax=Anaerosolibacter sp. TaxID=1872527 RepID=UPI0039F10BAF
MDGALKECCCKKEIESNRILQTDNLCPVCKKEGSKVRNITVRHLVLDAVIEQVGTTDYYLCMNEECDVAYYNSELGVRFNKEQVKVPIWFKRDANPKFVCYCSKVTEEQIINAVIKDGAKSMEDIIKLTGAMKNAQCQKNNPLGKCCHQIIQDAIVLSMSNRELIDSQ